MDFIRKGGPAVKRLIALILIALVALGMTGCDMLSQPDATPAPAQEEPTAEPTPMLTPTPAPTPVPTPVPVVEIKDYKYQKVTNEPLKISFEYPSHWINHPGNITISFVQPVNEGEVAARVAVSVKKISKNLDPDALKKQLEKLIDNVSGSFGSFRRSTISKKIKFMSGTAYSVVYEAELNGQTVKGFIIVGVKNAKNRVVALHFYAPADSYSDFEPVLKQVMDSVKLS